MIRLQREFAASPIRESYEEDTNSYASHTNFSKQATLFAKIMKKYKYTVES